MTIDLLDHTEDGDPIAVSCLYEIERYEPETNGGGYWNVLHIKYGDIQYPGIEDLAADFPDCAKELELLLDQAYEEYCEEKFYGRYDD